MAAPTLRKSSLPSQYQTQLSVISEEASQHNIDVTVSPSTSPVPSIPSVPPMAADERPERRTAPTPPASDVPNLPSRPGTALSMAPTTPTVAKRRSKVKAVVEFIRKHSSEFIESFKAHDFSKHRQEMNDVFALVYGTGMMTHKQHLRQEQKLSILRIRKLQERGVEWWTAVTRADQHKIDPPTDSLEDLLYAIKRGEEAVLRNQEFNKRLRGMYGGAVSVVYEADAGVGGGVKKEDDEVCFRCEIHAFDAKDYHDAEAECKQMVIEAGGKVLDEYEFIGGFLYSLPANGIEPSVTNPLANGDETLLGGYITIKSWTPFSPQGPNAYTAGIDEKEVVNELPGCDPDSVKDWPRPTTDASKQKMHDWILQQRTKVDEAAAAEEARRKLEAEEDEDEIVLGPRILDPGVELAILEPGRLLWSNLPSRPSSMHMAVQAVGRESRNQGENVHDDQREQRREQSWLESESSESGSINESDYDEDAVVLEAATAVRACASPVFLRKMKKE